MTPEQITAITGPIEYTAQFIPFDQSRNREFPSLNWLYRLTLGQITFEGDYMTGCWYRPPYPIKDRQEENKWQSSVCQTGILPFGGNVSPPTLSDIISCLLLDPLKLRSALGETKLAQLQELFTSL